MIIRSFLCACILLAGGCAAERAIVAQDAQTKMVGLNKEQVLACMGTPASKASEGQTEVWTYNSGNGQTSTFALSQATTSVRGTGMTTGNMTTASAVGSGTGTTFATTSQRYCIVSVVMAGGRVSGVNYSGPTGGLITGGEQCAFAVRNCVH
jgi:hypothetical protein